MEFRGPDISGGEGCECKKRVLYLEKKIERLEEIVQEKDEIISCLKGKSRQTTMELLELQLQMLQHNLSEKDSSLATMELKLKKDLDTNNTEKRQTLSSVKVLKAERNKLAEQLKSKVNGRFLLFQKDSEEELRELARQYQNCSKDQLCDELRSLELTIMKLKAYIDQLLAIALENNPYLLEGMPRIQQDTGLKLELFGVASLTELLEELHEREQNCQSLQEYASLLLQRLTEQIPDHLETLSQKWKDLSGVTHGSSPPGLLRPIDSVLSLKQEEGSNESSQSGHLPTSPSPPPGRTSGVGKE